jgi:hypothetical protein
MNVPHSVSNNQAFRRRDTQFFLTLQEQIRIWLRALDGIAVYYDDVGPDAQHFEGGGDFHPFAGCCDPVRNSGAV